MGCRHQWALVVAIFGAVAAGGRTSAQDGIEHAVNQYAIRLWFDSRPADARALMLGPQDRIWVGCGDGAIRILEDRNGDGIVGGDEARIFVAETWSPHGLAWRKTGSGNEVYVIHTTGEYGGNGQITGFTDRHLADRPGDDPLNSPSSGVKYPGVRDAQVHDHPGPGWFPGGAAARSGTVGGFQSAGARRA
jgi:hypothetical protein